MSLLYLDVTYRCNLNCLYCASHRTNTRTGLAYGPSLNQLMGLIKDSPATSIVHLSGGEPTLFEDLMALCVYATEKQKRVLLSTNGTACAEHCYAERLIGTGLACVAVPFLTTSEARHDWLVGRSGAFRDTLLGLQNLSAICESRSTELVVRILTMAPTLSDLSSIPRFLLGQGVIATEFQISGLHISQRVLANKFLLPSFAQLAVYVSQLIRELVALKQAFSVQDLPLCILEDDAVELYLARGILYPLGAARPYVKLNGDGLREGEAVPYRFSACAGCVLTHVCSGYHPRSIDHVLPQLATLTRTIAFQEA